MLNSRPIPSAAFTLIELLVVIAIIAILATLTLRTAGYIQSKGASSRTAVEIASIETAIESCKVDYGDIARSDSTAALNPASQPSPVQYPTAAAYLTAYVLGPGALGDDDNNNPNRYPEFKRWKVYASFPKSSLSKGTVTIDVPNIYYIEGEPTNLVVAVRYILDPYGNPYGYSTRGTYNGTNFYDLWSTRGNSTIGKTNEWIKNW